MADKIDMLKAVRVLAFRAVQAKESEYLFRYIMRWYSREFHTRLQDVEEIPIEEVLMHYFEDRYEHMSDEEIDEELGQLIETDAERIAREAKEELDRQDDDEFFEEMKAEAAAGNAKNATTPTDPSKKLEPDAPIVPVQMLGSSDWQTFPEDGGLPGKTGPIKPLPPDIKMEFVEPGAFDDLDEWDIMGPVKPKKDE
jgi:hypothetical protein